MRKSYLLLFFFVLLQWYPKLIHSAQFKNWYNTNYVQDIKSINNKIAIGSTRGLVIFTPEENEFIILNKIEGLLENQINGLVCDNENMFLFVPAGITVLSVDTTKIRNISSLITGIEGEPVTGLLQADTLFLGTTSYLYIWDTEGDPYNPFNTAWANEPYRFRNYGINTLFAMNETLYVGTDGGVCQVPNNDFADTTEWVWNTSVDGLPDDSVTSICYWRNEIWVGTKNGIVSGSMNNWTPRNSGLSSTKINSLFSSETLWVATENAPHYWVNSLSRWVQVYQGLDIKKTTGICKDNTGKLWVGIDGDGIAFREDTSWSVIRFPGPSSSNFSDIIIDNNGDIWGVHYGGYVQEGRGRTISHFHDGEWEIINENNEIGADGSIRWIEVDRYNNKWFGIWRQFTDVDIFKLSESGVWDTLSLPVVLGVVGTQFVDSKGNKWFSNFLSSVCKLEPDDSTWQVYTDENYLDFIAAIEEDKSGNMYFGSIHRGVSVLKPDNTWIRVTGLPSQQVNDLAIDNKGDLWVGTAGSGVAVVRNFETTVHYTYTASGLIGDKIMDICIDWKGNKWFLVENKGVSVLKYNGTWDSLLVDDGLASDFILDDLDGLAYDTEKGYLWIATKDGISRYETGIIPSSPDIENTDVYPNPFVPKEHNMVTFDKLPDDAKIYIYSISLKKIKTIDDIEEATHRGFWDGTDDNGKSVDSGIYIYTIINGNGQTKTGKIAVIR